MSDLLEQVLDDVEAHLLAGVANLSTDFPDECTVTKGDFATPDAYKIHLTVDWGGSNFSDSVSIQQCLLQETAQVVIRGYISDVPNDDLVNAAARALKSAIVTWMRKFSSGRGYTVAVASARYLLPAEKPGFRFTVGADVRYNVKIFG